ncbi:hypothetical protein Glove_153g4 [Diversispora epigaea]|uniref:C2H2-type domain-containing protein n=1 Tax=Diversispora epigaea TaxID=1348612 RepID=A0A397J227_9GLOM|nr:hypothetical protein Glove_153g4 [Diversispora epigaea]
MAFECPFCNRVLSNRSAYSQHVKRCSENYDSSSSSSSEEIQNEFDIITPEQDDNSEDNRNNEIIYISDDEPMFKETETIPKFPNNTYSDLMTLIIQHNLNNKAGNAIIRFFNKHSNLPTSPLPKNIEQGRKLMDRMKLINLLNKEKTNNNRNYNKQYTSNWWARTEKTLPTAYLPIIKAKDDTQKISEEHKNIVRRTFHKSLKFLLSPSSGII